MPSTSARQAKLMMIAAHTKGGYGGVPQKVGKDFYKADTGHAAHARHAKAIHKRVDKPTKHPMSGRKGY